MSPPPFTVNVVCAMTGEPLRANGMDLRISVGFHHTVQEVRLAIAQAMQRSPETIAIREAVELSWRGTDRMAIACLRMRNRSVHIVQLTS